MKILQNKLDLERKLLNEKMEREKNEMGRFSIFYFLSLDPMIC